MKSRSIQFSRASFWSPDIAKFSSWVTNCRYFVRSLLSPKVFFFLEGQKAMEGFPWGELKWSEYSMDMYKIIFMDQWHEAVVKDFEFRL